MFDFVANSGDWASVSCYAAAALGCVYALAAVRAARGFVQSATLAAPNYPTVTILKPLHGAEPNLYANLAGFCVQDYPSPVQIVFGVSDPADPAIGIVRDSSVPRRTPDLFDCARLPQFPDQRVFTAAATQNENFHNR